MKIVQIPSETVFNVSCLSGGKNSEFIAEIAFLNIHFGNTLKTSQWYSIFLGHSVCGFSAEVRCCITKLQKKTYKERESTEMAGNKELTKYVV